MKKKIIKEYEVNSCTMFLKPVEYGGRIYTHIVEIEDEFLSPHKPWDIIKNSCKYFGFDYESRKRGTRQLIGYSRKIPIVIEQTTHIYFFPTKSPNDAECIWISLGHVEDHSRIAPQQTEVFFRNKQSYVFSVPVSTINSQMLRTSLLKIKLLQRIENSEKKLYYVQHRSTSLKASESSEFYLKDPK